MNSSFIYNPSFIGGEGIPPPGEDRPLISIITVVFNGALTLKKTIRSIEEIKRKDIEYIIIDGGSTDGTIEIVREHRNVVDLFISETDDGIYDAMNKGLQQAKGDWCIFIGSDDYLLDNFKIAISYLKERNSIYYGLVISDSIVIGEKSNRWEILRKNIPHQAIFYPKSAYKNNKFYIKYKICADHEYNIRLFHKRVRAHFINIPIAYFGSDGLSSLYTDEDFTHDYLNIVRINAGLIAFISIFIGKKIKSLVSRCLSYLR